MEKNIVDNFEQQMSSVIYECAFSSVDKWQKHLLYMAANPKQDWINLLSVFNCRDKPQRVLRMSDWINELGINPCIKKGLSGIPVMVRGNVSYIKHDAWDINDFEQNFVYSVTCPLLKAVRSVEIKYKLKYDSDFWQFFIKKSIQSNNKLATYAKDQKMMEFYIASFFYILYGENITDITILKNYHVNDLCIIYSNLYLLFSKIPEHFLEYATKEGEEKKEKEKFDLLMTRSERKLPQRIYDAGISMGKKENKKKTSYGPEDTIERNKFK